MFIFNLNWRSRNLLQIIFLLFSGLVPLHNACSYGHFEVTELLIKVGIINNNIRINNSLCKIRRNEPSIVNIKTKLSSKPAWVSYSSDDVSEIELLYNIYLYLLWRVIFVCFSMVPMWMQWIYGSLHRYMKQPPNQGLNTNIFFTLRLSVSLASHYNIRKNLHLLLHAVLYI